MPWVPGVEHGYVDVDGLLMHAAEAGEGDPIVLLHGWPRHWYLWRDLIPQLATDRRVICPDLRGFGWTEAPAGGYGKDQLATDVLGLLDRLGVDRFDLVGHDWGAYTGFLIALREPARVKYFLAMAMTHPWPEVAPLLRQQWRFAYMALLDKPLASSLLLQHVPRLVRTVLRAGVVDSNSWDPDELEIFVERTRDPARAAAASSLYRAFTIREALPLMRGRYRDSRLEVPTRLIVGAHDPAIRAEMLGGFEGHADDMSVEVVRDAGHFIVDEHPDLVLERIRDFMG